MDEVRHSSLSWVAVKWIIDQTMERVEVSDIKWWRQKLLAMKEGINNNNSNNNAIYEYIYNDVISSILDLLWAQNGDLIEIEDYAVLYDDIKQLMENQFKIKTIDNRLKKRQSIYK
eukprot:TRINITY_DN27813_c0_g1_i1.p1 TRINITY_DN27813_c0_g1~~TRINITY_DN27813_c0_g1_i1.p1  ORF type:complete len:129 (-),score=25.44 TRINITY_DN27813_c0_g1_i1:289-636(-)